MDPFRKKVMEAGGERNFASLQPGRSAMPPGFELKASNPGGGEVKAAQFLSGSVGKGGQNRPFDLAMLIRFLLANGLPAAAGKTLREPGGLGDFLSHYQQEVLGWGNGDGRADPGGKTLTALLNRQGLAVAASWFTHEAGSAESQGAAVQSKPAAQATQGLKPGGGSAGKVGADGWTIAPVLSKGEYFSQAHPGLVRGVKPVPRAVAFSGALKKYDRGGSQDIYDESKVKKSWQKLSITKREQKVYWRACKNTATYMARQKGYADTGSTGSLQTLVEEGKGAATQRKAAQSFGGAVSRLDQLLEAGIPVVAGVDKGKRGLNASATDHFIVIVGRGVDANGKYYLYFDPGRTYAAGSDTSKNRLYVGKNAQGESQTNTIAGQSGKHAYTLSEVRQMQKTT